MTILTFADFRSIRSGAAKAKRDYAKILAHMAEHHARHDIDPDYNCGPWNKDFWANIGKDVHPDKDLFEAAAYRSAVDRYQKQYQKANPEEGDGLKASFVTLEMDGNETPADVLRKLRQAIADQVVIDALDKSVSETADASAPESGPKHSKKGDK